jgi:D-alanine-D-alanine ligase
MKTIAIAAGGYSSEYVISVQSAAQVYNAIDKQKFKPFIVEITRNDWFVKLTENDITSVDKNDFSVIINDEKIKFDCVFIAIHGTPGEDGKLQSYFEMLNIPYTSCNSFTSLLTFNKYATKIYLEKAGILSANAVLVRGMQKVNANPMVKHLGLPAFVKPNNAGSSFGVTKVKLEEQLQKAVEDALKEDKEVIVEEFIEGTEVTCGIAKLNNREIVLPLTEIVSKKEFFDYEAKYTPGMSDEITPARIDEALTWQIQHLSSRIYDLLDCKGLVRVDFIIKKGEPYFLEINTVPGMSKNSIVPKMIRISGMTETEVYGMLIEETLNNADFQK